MKLQALALSAGMMVASVSAFAIEDIKPGAPVGSCCRVGGAEGSSQQITLDGALVWTCQLNSNDFQVSWEAGRLPYSVFVDRLRGSIGTWTPWFNLDLPSGSGDYELLQGLIDSKQVCANPLMIECQTAKDGIDWSDTHLVYHCDLSRGGYCVNREQAAGQSCEDFKVRYLCANIQLDRPDPVSGFVP
jgi:hypothetical protein